MSEMEWKPISEAQQHISGRRVALMIQEFWREFEGVYPQSTMESSLCAVGPLHAMIGLAIKNGHLALPSPPKGE